MFSSDTKFHFIALLDSLRYDISLVFRHDHYFLGQMTNILAAYHFHFLQADKTETWIFWSVLNYRGQFSYSWIRNPEF